VTQCGECASRVTCYTSWSVITVALLVTVEDEMELLSDIVTWGELYLDHWQEGSYTCSKCSNLLYRSEDKWKVKVQKGCSVVQ
jgi:hypothetical protein